jgi:hypothetical protein
VCESERESEGVCLCVDRERGRKTGRRRERERERESERVCELVAERQAGDRENGKTYNVNQSQRDRESERQR